MNPHRWGGNIGILTPGAREWVRVGRGKPALSGSLLNGSVSLADGRWA